MPSACPTSPSRNVSGIDFRACRFRSVWPICTSFVIAWARRLRVRRRFDPRQNGSACSLRAFAFSTCWRSFVCCGPSAVAAVTCARRSARRQLSEAKLGPTGTAAHPAGSVVVVVVARVVLVVLVLVVEVVVVTSRIVVVVDVVSVVVVVAPGARQWSYWRWSTSIPPLVLVSLIAEMPAAFVTP